MAPMRRAALLLGALLVLGLAAGRPVAAQGNFEIQVYGSETTAPRATMIELHSGFEFSPNVKVTRDVTPAIAPGLEYYGALGPVRGFDPPRQQEHLLFAVVDLDLGPRWEFNAGIGAGLTPATDGLIFKMILGYRFP
ncbi:MAG: hypothetical protein HY216_14440 [Candidatus Rokubacteria bacterium]|nr:hypothetical protein [Candidatus Rokubacteria bacterium]